MTKEFALSFLLYEINERNRGDKHIETLADNIPFVSWLNRVLVRVKRGFSRGFGWN